MDNLPLNNEHVHEHEQFNIEHENEQFNIEHEQLNKTTVTR